jgi:Zn-dependent protease with chaperone function
MEPTTKPEQIRYKMKRGLKALWGGIVSVFFVLLIVVFWGANISSCISGGDTARESEAKKLKIVEASDKNDRHVKIKHALDSVWFGASNAKEDPKLFIVDSPDINAASFGSGRFLVWDGVADLPDSAIKAIFAHEVAHDILRHSKKAQDMKDLTDFFGDALSVFGQVDAGTENTLKKWVGYTTLPKYSRNQEFEADAKGVEILTELGDQQPEKELSDALQVLLDKYGNIGGGFLDDHPSTAERIKRLRSQAERRTKK